MAAIQRKANVLLIFEKMLKKKKSGNMLNSFCFFSFPLYFEPCISNKSKFVTFRTPKQNQTCLFAMWVRFCHWHPIKWENTEITTDFHNFHWNLWRQKKVSSRLLVKYWLVICSSFVQFPILTNFSINWSTSLV